MSTGNSFENYFEDPASVEQAPIQQEQAPIQQQADPKFVELQQQFQQFQQQQEQQKQAVLQAYGVNKTEELNPDLKAAYELIDKRIEGKIGGNPAFNQSQLISQAAKEMKASSVAEEFGINGYTAPNGQYYSAWEVAKQTYDPLLKQLYFSPASSPQLRADIESVYSQSVSSGNEKELLEKVIQITGYNPKRQNNITQNQSTGHFQNNNNIQQDGNGAYLSSVEWFRDFSSTNSEARARAQRALNEGRVPTN